MFEDLYRYLKSKGFNVCSIGQQDKVCTKPFILFYTTGTEQTNSKNLNKESIELWLFYPFGTFSQVDKFIKEVEGSIKEFGKLRRQYEPSAIQIDGDMKAYYTKLSYFRYVRRF